VRIIAGLGNPGPDYRMTRHNAGVMLVEKLAEGLASDYGWRAEKEALVFRNSDYILVKPKDKFMNQSGEWIKWVLGYVSGGAEIKDLWVAHDDLDIKLGEYKIQFGVGPKDHGGINSTEAILGNKEFWRIRIGVDGRDKEFRLAGEDYVLMKFSADEKQQLDEVINKAVEEIMQNA